MKENNQVKRSLKTRHLSMIALGGSIGTGLFVASGSAISTAGPGGALAAYLGIGIMVYFLILLSQRILLIKNATSLSFIT